MYRALVFLFSLSICLSPISSFAATPAEVNAAVKKGVQFMAKELGTVRDYERCLIALALIKGKAPKDSPEVQKVLGEILAKFKGGRYRTGGYELYVAGVEATILADFDPVKYRPQLQILTDYIIGQQMDNGGWDYPGGGHGPGSKGDTSVIQYACLGLWAAERAGIEVNPKVWEKTLNWHIQHQSPDGGYAYCPGLKTGEEGGESSLNMSVNAIGSYHIAMLHIKPTFLPLQNELRKEQSEKPKEKPKFGVLEAVEIEAPVETKVNKAEIPPAAVNGVRRTFGYLKSRFAVENRESGYSAYYYYSLERMAALANIKKIGSRDWFNECADHLLKQQKKDGSWEMSSKFKAPVDTAFAVLFLTRSTGRLLKRVETPEFGDGLLAGGRGLPDDLTDVDFNGRTVKMKEKPTEPLDILLASLSKTGGLENLDEVQDQIVEQVQLGNREDLIGQVDQLVKLVDHPDPGIRQTVVWALGRTGNMNLAKHLVERLSDENLNVMIEARNALCWISRKPLGFGFPEDPLIDLSDNAPQDRKNAAIAQWHKNMVLTWGEWYLKNRPYEDRGDAFEAELRRKMDKLKYGF